MSGAESAGDDTRAEAPEVGPADALDLEEFRRDAHEMVDWVADYLAGLGERPVCDPVQPGAVRAQLPDVAPEEPEPFSEVLDDFHNVIASGLMHWQHPGFFGFFPAMSSPPAVLGDIATAGLNVITMMWSTGPAAAELEAHVLDWLVDLTGVPQAWKSAGPGGGVINSGASESTFIALLAAREQCRRRTGASAEQMVAYASVEAHSSVQKGARVAGFGHFRALEVDERFAMTPEALAEAVADDLRRGLIPAVVTSTLGTTGTTGVDPIRAIGEISRAEQLWHHCDAAYAGSAMICDEFRHHQHGLELVDSYVFNPHKWMATGMGCSVLWLADRAPLIETMSINPAYLRNEASESGQVIDYRDWTLPLGRPFRALKLWFVLRRFGAEGLRSMIRHHVSWAQDLAARIDAHPRLRRVAPVDFSLVCFVNTEGDHATRALAEAVNATGRFHLTVSETKGHPYIRVAVGSTWCTQTQVENLWQTIKTNTEPSSHKLDSSG